MNLVLIVVWIKHPSFTAHILQLYAGQYRGPERLRLELGGVRCRPALEWTVNYHSISAKNTRTRKCALKEALGCNIEKSQHQLWIEPELNRTVASFTYADEYGAIDRLHPVNVSCILHMQSQGGCPNGSLKGIYIKHAKLSLCNIGSDAAEIVNIIFSIRPRIRKLFQYLQCDPPVNPFPGRFCWYVN
jgi:hypothetical protein